jgi:hypothetical protein
MYVDCVVLADFFREKAKALLYRKQHIQSFVVLADDVVFSIVNVNLTGYRCCFQGSWLSNRSISHQFAADLPVQIAVVRSAPGESKSTVLPSICIILGED